MVYSPTMPNMKLTAQDLGAPDYQQALQNVFNNVYKPPTLQAQLLDAQLQNKINQPKAADAQNWYDIQKQVESARAKLYGAQANQASMDYLQNKQFYDALSNVYPGSRKYYSENNDINDANYNQNQSYQPLIYRQLSNPEDVPMEHANQNNPSVNASQQNLQNIPQSEYVNSDSPEIGHSQIINPGSSSMYQLDKLYDENPFARIGLEKKGFKKTQTVKVDPSSGVTSVVTTYPSGKTEFKLLNSGSNIPFNKEIAKEDAKTLAEIEQSALGAGDQLSAVSGLSDVVAGPIFTQMRQNPLLGKYELQYFAKQGTPEQQNEVGKFMSYAGEIVKRASTDFKGQFRKGEQQLLEGMKPTLSDSIDSAKGKIEALQYLLERFKQRAELESKFMRERNMSPIKARQAADLLINQKQIKEDINKKLYPIKYASTAELLKKAGE